MGTHPIFESDFDCLTVQMDLDDPAELRNELSRLYRALEEKDLRLKQTAKQNEKLKSDLEIYSSASGSGQIGNQGHAAKKIIELGKKTRSITTELESEKTKVRGLEKDKRDLDKKVSQLASKLAAANIEASAGDAYSMSSFAQERIQCAPYNFSGNFFEIFFLNSPKE